MIAERPSEGKAGEGKEDVGAPMAVHSSAATVARLNELPDAPVAAVATPVATPAASVYPRSSEEEKAATLEDPQVATIAVAPVAAPETSVAEVADIDARAPPAVAAPTAGEGAIPAAPPAVVAAPAHTMTSVSNSELPPETQAVATAVVAEPAAPTVVHAQSKAPVVHAQSKTQPVVRADNKGESKTEKPRKRSFLRSVGAAIDWSVNAVNKGIFTVMRASENGINKVMAPVDRMNGGSEVQSLGKTYVGDDEGVRQMQAANPHIPVAPPKPMRQQLRDELADLGDDLRRTFVEAYTAPKYWLGMTSQSSAPPRALHRPAGAAAGAPAGYAPVGEDGEDTDGGAAAAAATATATATAGDEDAPAVSAAPGDNDKGAPLPAGWEWAYDDSGRVFFICHAERRTTYDDPRIPH